MIIIYEFILGSFSVNETSFSQEEVPPSDMLSFKHFDTTRDSHLDVNSEVNTGFYILNSNIPSSE